MNDIIMSTNKDARNVEAFGRLTKHRRLDMNIVTEKHCTKCGETKGYKEFNKNKKSKDGLGVWCRKCTNEYLVDYRIKKPASKEYNKIYRQNNKEKLSHKQREYAEKNREAVTAYKSLWYEQNKEITKQRASARRLLHPRSTVESRRALLKRYGMTQDDYNEMYISQNGCCMICGLWFEKLHVDHDHETGEVRSLLCANCNRALGMVKEKVSTLEKAISYLLKWTHK